MGAIPTPHPQLVEYNRIVAQLDIFMSRSKELDKIRPDETMEFRKPIGVFVDTEGEEFTC